MLFFTTPFIHCMDRDIHKDVVERVAVELEKIMLSVKKKKEKINLTLCLHVLI